MAQLQGRAWEAGSAAADAAEHLEVQATLDAQLRDTLESLWRRSDRVGRVLVRELLRVLELEAWHRDQAHTYANAAHQAAANLAQTCERHLNKEPAG